MDKRADDAGGPRHRRSHGGLIGLAVLVVIALLASAMLAGPAMANHKPGHKDPPGQGHGHKPPKPKPPKPKPPKPKPPKPKPPKPPKTGVHDNRGTIKVHEGAGEPSPLMRNEPQVCDFHIHMFKFHAGQALTISIVGQGGNAGTSTYATTVTTDANGDARAPAAGAITTFADGSYKVSVDTGRGGPGKQDKHKVFKVDCADDDSPPPPDDEGGTPPPPPGDEGGNPPPPPGDDGGNGDNQVDQPRPGGDEVAGPDAPVPGNGPEVGNPPGNAPDGQPKPGDLPDTATDAPTSDSAPAIVFLGLLLAVAAGFQVRTRRRVTTS